MKAATRAKHAPLTLGTAIRTLHGESFQIRKNRNAIENNGVRLAQINRTSGGELKSCRHCLFGAKIEKGDLGETHFSTVSLK
jgi:hypothetical protein